MFVKEPYSKQNGPVCCRSCDLLVVWLELIQVTEAVWTTCSIYALYARHRYPFNKAPTPLGRYVQADFRRALHVVSPDDAQPFRGRLTRLRLALDPGKRRRKNKTNPRTRMHYTKECQRFLSTTVIEAPVNNSCQRQKSTTAFIDRSQRLFSTPRGSNIG